MELIFSTQSPDIADNTAMNSSSNGSFENQNETYGFYGDPYANLDLEARMWKGFSDPHVVIQMTLASIAVTFNLFSLSALFHIRSRMNSHYRFIISLSASDTLIGLILLFYLINKIFNPVFAVGLGASHSRLKARCTFMFLKGLYTTGLNISLLNLMGMSIDHYIAINKPLHYPKLMSKYRATVMLIVLWSVAILCGFSDFFTGLTLLKTYIGYNYCELVWLTPFREEYIMMAIAFVCLCVMLLIYIQIYTTVSRHRSPGETQHTKNDDHKNRRALITTLLILGSFIICWLPLCLFQIIMIIKVRMGDTKVDESLVKLYKADKYLSDLLLLNSICDPIIYTVRTYEVQLGYKRLFYRCILRRPFFDKSSASRSSNYTTMTLLEKKDSGESDSSTQGKGNKSSQIKSSHKSQIKTPQRISCEARFNCSNEAELRNAKVCS